MIRKQLCPVLLGMLLGPLATPGVVAGVDLVPERVRLSGFGTLGLTRAGDEVLGYRRNQSRSGVFDGQWAFETDTLLGLQVDARLTPNLDAALQLVGMDRPENTLGESVEWAFLRYSLGPSLVVRAGRMGVDLFMLSNYRNVGFAYLWARPPVEFYGSIAFDHFDGADITYTTPLGKGTLQSKLFGGQTKSAYTTKVGDASVDLEPLFGGSLAWESEHWRVRVGFASGKFASSFAATEQLGGILRTASQTPPPFAWPEAATLAESLEPKGKSTRYYSAGIAYDHHPWVVQSELGYVDSDYEVFLPLFSTYLSVGRRIGPATLYGMAALSKTTEDRVLLSGAPPIWFPLQQQTQAYYDGSLQDQHTLSLGLRWDLRHNMALKLQWDHHRVEPYGGALWFQQTQNTDRKSLDTFSVNLDFVF